MPTKTVLIFGVFDGIHDGHKAFIHEARAQGDRLIAIVARDETVSRLKGRSVVNSEVFRINELLKMEDIDLVLLGDEVEGSYKSLLEVNPDVIYLGYDQEALLNDIKKSMKKGYLPKAKIIQGQPYHPEIFHSSILNKGK